MKPFRFCKAYLLLHKYALIGFATITLTSAIISIMSPYIIGDFLDTLIYGADMGVILRFCIIFGGLSLLRIVKGYVSNVLFIKIQIKLNYDLTKNITQYIQSLSLSYINQKDSAYLSQRVGSDSIALIGFCMTLLKNIITNFLILVVPFVILLFMNRLITLLMLSFTIVYMISYFAFVKPLYNAGLAVREAQANFMSKMLEQFQHMKLIKMNSIQNEMIENTDSSYVNIKDTSIHNQKVTYLYSSLDGIISTIAQIVLFVIGGIQVLEGNFTIGMFTVFTSYFNMMLGASRYFFGIGASYQKTLTVYDRIMDILNQKPESRGKKSIHDIKQIELNNLTFSYDSKGQIISHFNAAFSKGRIYGIAGENGKGKSTLISLIMGMYIDEYEGQIAYDGVDIRDIDMEAARKNLLGFAEQEPQLVSYSIRYNLDFQQTGNSGDMLHQLDKHIKTLNMENFITSNSLDFIINEKNTNISGGEKQKISILRVLHKNPVVMIFDEPTSALDSQTTKNFMEYLERVKADKIIIIITHEETVLDFCDKILVI